MTAGLRAKGRKLRAVAGAASEKAQSLAESVKSAYEEGVRIFDFDGTWYFAYAEQFGAERTSLVLSAIGRDEVLEQQDLDDWRGDWITVDLSADEVQTALREAHALAGPTATIPITQGAKDWKPVGKLPSLLELRSLVTGAADLADYKILTEHTGQMQMIRSLNDARANALFKGLMGATAYLPELQTAEDYLKGSRTFTTSTRAFILNAYTNGIPRHQLVGALSFPERFMYARSVQKMYNSTANSLAQFDR